MADPTRHHDVTAKDLLRNPAVLNGYPYRYLLVFTYSNRRHWGELLEAVEMLESQGAWVLHNLSSDSTATRMYALMRRTG